MRLTATFAAAAIQLLCEPATAVAKYVAPSVKSNEARSMIFLL
jgi:hypothetical protein